MAQNHSGFEIHKFSGFEIHATWDSNAVALRDEF